MGHVTLETFLTGSLPDNLEELTAICRNLTAIARRIIPLTSLVVASARHDHFSGQVAPWIAWCRDNLGLEGTELHHRRQIGDCLLLIRDAKPDLLPRLIALDSKKLQQLCRLSAVQIAPFLSRYKVESMDRAAVRDAVEAYLGIAPKDRRDHKQLELPGFEAAVDALTAIDGEDYRTIVRDGETAYKSLTAGMALLGASLEYQDTAPVADLKMLKDAKAALLEEAARIDAIIHRAAAPAIAPPECDMAHTTPTLEQTPEPDATETDPAIIAVDTASPECDMAHAEPATEMQPGLRKKRCDMAHRDTTVKPRNATRFTQDHGCDMAHPKTGD